jgi:hypothetical protein
MSLESSFGDARTDAARVEDVIATVAPSRASS